LKKEMASRYCLNESNRFVEVDTSDCNLQVTIFQQREEKKKAVLTPSRWAQLVHISEEVNEAVKSLMKNQLTTALQIHLGGKWHVSVTPGYRCVDIRHFYWNRRERKQAPTRTGIALRLPEWTSFLEMMSHIHLQHPELSSAQPCWARLDHSEQV
jgi:hypothetical protein